TPLASIARGLAAGTVGTLAMDLTLYARYRRSGGTSRFRQWEFSAELDSWEQAPAPAQFGKRLFEGIFRRELPVERAVLVNNLTHWGYGILNGAPYGVLAGSARHSLIRYGIPFGAGVWATSYVVLPAAKLYRPIWEYDVSTLAKDLGTHLVYGLSTAAAFKLGSTHGGNS
ncbi:MAG: hypothetical protein WAV00_02375, partial [Nocardioides sp.]